MGKKNESKKKTQEKVSRRKLDETQLYHGIMGVKRIVTEPPENPDEPIVEYVITFNPEFTDEVLDIVKVSSDKTGEISISVTPRLCPGKAEKHNYKIDEDEIIEFAHYFGVR